MILLFLIHRVLRKVLYIDYLALAIVTCIIYYSGPPADCPGGSGLPQRRLVERCPQRTTWGGRAIAKVPQTLHSNKNQNTRTCTYIDFFNENRLWFVPCIDSMWLFALDSERRHDSKSIKTLYFVSFCLLYLLSNMLVYL